MARKKSYIKKYPQPKTAYFFPWLQHQVTQAVIADGVRSRWVNTKTNHRDPNNRHSTNVMGKFTCVNDICDGGVWNSKMVAMLIKGYPDNGYNAVVFNQRCKSCNELGHFTLDEDSYVERVAYWLKKWAGVRMEAPPYSGRDGPHTSVSSARAASEAFVSRDLIMRVDSMGLRSGRRAGSIPHVLEVDITFTK